MASSIKRGRPLGSGTVGRGMVETRVDFSTLKEFRNEMPKKRKIKGQKKGKSKYGEESDEEVASDVDSMDGDSQGTAVAGLQIDDIVARRQAGTFKKDALDGPFEYLIKYKNVSYLHLEWFTEGALIEFAGPRVKPKIKRFHISWEKRLEQNASLANTGEDGSPEIIDGEDEVSAKVGHWATTGSDFDPQNTEVERILAQRTMVFAFSKPPVQLPKRKNHTPETDPFTAAAAGLGSLLERPAETSAAAAVPLSGDDEEEAYWLPDDFVEPVSHMKLGDLRRLHDEYYASPYQQEMLVAEAISKLRTVDAAEADRKLHRDSYDLNIADLQQKIAMWQRDREYAMTLADVEHLNAQIIGATQSIETFLRDRNTAETYYAEEIRQLLNNPNGHRFAPRVCNLVKWRGLSYLQSTWEWEEAIDDDLKIATFMRHETPPTGVAAFGAGSERNAGDRPHKAKSPMSEVEEAARKRALLERKDYEKRLDRARFNRATQILESLSVPSGLKPFACQLECAGLVQPGDEIICVNGERCTGLRTEAVFNLIRASPNIRFLRFLRRDNGQAVEIQFDYKISMGFIMDELSNDAEEKSGPSWMAKSKKKQSLVENSSRIKKFSTPDDYARPKDQPPPVDKTNPVVRSAVITAFVARERLSPLTLQKCADESGVNPVWLQAWFSKQVAKDEILAGSESLLQSWVARCAQAFSCSPSVDIQTIEQSLIHGVQMELPERKDYETFADQNRAFAQSWLDAAQNELMQVDSRFEVEARRQEKDFVDCGAFAEVVPPSVAVLAAAGAAGPGDGREDDDSDEEDDQRETITTIGYGSSVHQQQLNLITAIHMGKKKFVEYSDTNLQRFKNMNALRQYQMQGVNWLVSKWYQGMNCILADEMGLGKTVQVVAFLEHLRAREQLRGPYLIIAPLSTMGHWRREFENWTDANVCFYYDSKSGRELIRKYEWFYDKLGRRHDVCKFNVLLTTYEAYIADAEDLSQLPFLSVVIDEGHRLKNQGGRLLNELRRLNVQHRLLLSGTPLQNNLQELWSLLNFCEPRQFDNVTAFLKTHGDLKTKEDLERLQKEISPYMLRRVKEDVEKSIPPKEEIIVDVELTLTQKRYYRAIFERNREFLYKGCKGNNKPQLVNVEVELRKCCNHPYLIAGARDKEDVDFRKKFLLTHGRIPETAVELQGPSASAIEAREQLRKYQNAIVTHMIATSGKLVVVDKLLSKLKSEGRKVLIFSQMVTMLDVLSEFLRLRGYQFERIDGSVRGNQRQDAIDRFSKENSTSFVFLLSTRAGGVGINLTAADTVIIYDSDWNPQNDAQAQARCHRIGQDKPVSIYRLVTKNSYEETMLDRAAKKLGLEQAVLGGAQARGSNGKDFTPEELERMLRLGAYHHLHSSDADDMEAEDFMKQDIETILATRTRKVKVDGIRGTVSLELTHNTLSGDGNPMEGTTTSAPSFKSSKIDVNDPDFWAKVLPKEDNEDTLLFKLGESAGLSELKSDAGVRLQFFQRVGTLVNEILSIRERGEVVDFHRMDTMIQLLVQIANLQGIFGPPVAAAASKMKRELDASMERKSRLKSREMQLEVNAILQSPSPARTSSSAMARAAAVVSPTASADDDLDDIEVEGGKTSSGKGTRKVLLPDGFAQEACGICFTGGNDLVPCTGRCGLAFHAKCHAAFGEGGARECDDCGIGAKCAVCRNTGQLCAPGQFALNAECVKRCSRPDCHRYYHRECIVSAHMDDFPSKLVLFSKKLGEEDEFVCPVHKCIKCHRGDGPSVGPVSLHCMQCFKGSHLPCMVPTATLRCSRHLMVCPDHLDGRKFPLEDHTRFGELAKKRMRPSESKVGSTKKPKASENSEEASPAVNGGGGGEDDEAALGAPIVHALARAPRTAPKVILKVKFPLAPGGAAVQKPIETMQPSVEIVPQSAEAEVLKSVEVPQSVEANVIAGTTE